MEFAPFCHQLDNDHVKGNFILCTLMIQSPQFFCRKTSQRCFTLTPVFAVLAKNNETSFRFSVKFKVVLIVFAAFCHTLDIDHVKSYFIFFAMNIKVMVISWGKAS